MYASRLKKASTSVGRAVGPRLNERSEIRSRPLQVMQRALGNEAFGVLQAKLTLGQPGDRYEHEADRVADAVMRMPEPCVQRQGEPEAPEEEELRAKSVGGQITPLVQRQDEVKDKEEDEEEEEEGPVQVKLLTASAQVQRNELDEKEDEEVVNAKSTPGQAPEVTPGLEARINAMRSNGGQPLDSATRVFMEPRFGFDFSPVRVHTGSRAAESARALNARAFTVGKDVVFGRGQYMPRADRGRRLIAHELTHVIQQQQETASAPLPCLGNATLGDQVADQVARSSAMRENRKSEKENTTSRKASPGGNKLEDIYALFRTLDRVLKHQYSTELWVKTRHSGKKWARWMGSEQSVRKYRNIYAIYRESSTSARRSQIVRLIARARELIDGLSKNDFNSDWSAEISAEGIKADLYQRLNLYSPYYTQAHNINLLREFGGKKNEAWQRTCGLTSIAMALEALGLGAVETFGGNKKKLAKIAAGLPEMEGLPSNNISYSDLAQLRLPDFLQLLVIYCALEKKELVKAEIKKAWTKARKITTVHSTFSAVIKLMGAKMDKEQKSVEKEELRKYIKSGAQVLLHARKPAHWVRMQGFWKKGVVIDDPWKRGKNYHMTFGEFREKFNYCYVVSL